MKAGRELDALVAEKVKGITFESEIRKGADGHMHDPFDDENNLPRYSTDIKAAWEVLDAILDTEDLVFHLYSSQRWDTVKLKTWDSGKVIHSSWGETTNDICGSGMAHAICLAALKAVGVDIDADHL